MMLEENAKTSKHDEDATAKAENFQVELGAAAMQNNRKRGVAQQKPPSKLSHQDKCYSSMAHFFIHSSSFPPFNAFRHDTFLTMMNVVSGESDFKPLTTPHLKACLNAEHDAFEQASHQALPDHHEEANENQFSIFA